MLFMANDIKNKGRANKTYTLKLVNSQHNDEQLSQIFSSKDTRTVLFDCTYDIENITMQGVLKITSIFKTHAEGIFISGNGKLWESLDNMNVRDYDWSALDHTLNETNVTASEAGGDYVYDLCDRGRFINEAELVDDTRKEFATLASVDITERYPALNIKTIFETILHEEGYGITWASNVYNTDLDDLYLLMMEDHRIRNDAEWEKSAVFEAEGDGESQNVTQPSAPAYIWNVKLQFPTENYDNGGNFTGSSGTGVSDNIYTIPETGTYRFQCDIKLTFQISGATITTDTISIGIYNATTTAWLYRRDYDSGDLDAFNSITEEMDTMPVELTADDQIYVRVIWDTATSGYPYTLTITQGGDEVFYNSVSRYYGAGSTVSFSRLVPDMKALDLFEMVCNYLNLYTFYREETHVLEIQHGRQDQSSAATFYPVDYSEEVQPMVNYEFVQNTDKALPPDNIYVDNSAPYEDSLSFKFSRTLFGNCMRLIADTSVLIPILWSDGDPENWFNVIDPPEWKTKGNYRILRYTGTESYSYTLTYGGDYTANSETKTVIPVFEEVDIEAFHRYETVIMEGSGVVFYSPVDMNRLYNQDYFKSPVMVYGFGMYWIKEAEQISGNIYKFKALK